MIARWRNNTERAPLPTQGLPDVEDNSVATYQLQTNVSKFKCSLLGLVLDTRRCAKWLRFLRKRTKWNDQCIARNNNFYSKTVLSSEHKTRGSFTFRSIAGQRGGRRVFSKTIRRCIEDLADKFSINILPHPLFSVISLTTSIWYPPFCCWTYQQIDEKTWPWNYTNAEMLQCLISVSITFTRIAREKTSLCLRMYVCRLT